MMDQAHDNATSLTDVKSEIPASEHSTSQETSPVATREHGAEKQKPSVLRWPGPDEASIELALGDAREVELFFRTGIHPSSDGSSHIENFHPAVLHHYLTTGGFRKPWPLTILVSGDSVHVRPLTETIDSALADLSADGDELEIQKRILYQFEHLIETYSSSKEVVLHNVLPEIKADLLESKKGKGDLGESVETAYDTLLRSFNSGEVLLPFGSEAAFSILEQAVHAETRKRTSAFREELDWLTARLSDLIRMEDEDSPEAVDSDKLEHTVGGSFVNEFDFDSLSHLLEEGPHGPTMGDERRARISNVVATIERTTTSLFEGSPPTHDGSVDKIIERMITAESEFTDLIRAVHVARLEVENKYRPGSHDQLFADFNTSSLGDNFLKMRPPLVVHVNASSDVRTIPPVHEIFQSSWPLKLLFTFDEVLSDRAELTAESNLGLSTVSAGQAFISQCCLSEATTLQDDLQAAAKTGTHALCSVFVGSAESHPMLEPYLRSAVAGDSRLFPSFRFDPTAGPDWADRFTATSNEQPSEDWPTSEIKIELENGDTTQLVVSAIDYCATDVRFASLFAPLAQDLDVEALDFIENVVASMGNQADSSVTNIPIVHLSSREGLLARFVVSRSLVAVARAARDRWRLIQEWSGEKSSVAERYAARLKKELEQEHEIHLNEVNSEFELKLTESVNNVAQQVVNNIASSLLGLSSAQMPMPVPSTGTAQKPTSDVPAAENTLEASPSVADSPSVEHALDESADDDDDLVIQTDEAYIDTPLCTTCNECTDLNGVLFAYDENKQAYIKDIAAGTFRELVLAAEKCPVRIIHPGKPNNPEEPGLEEWIERAKPFN